jgi:hypothetical protein
MNELVGGIEIGAQSTGFARKKEPGRVEIYQGATTGHKKYFRDLISIRGPRCEGFTQATGIQGDGVHRAFQLGVGSVEIVVTR